MRGGMIYLDGWLAEGADVAVDANVSLWECNNRVIYFACWGWGCGGGGVLLLLFLGYVDLLLFLWVTG